MKLACRWGSISVISLFTEKPVQMASKLRRPSGEMSSRSGNHWNSLVFYGK
jgi:hypothetical protein